MRLAPSGLPWLVWWDLKIRLRSLNVGRVRLLPIVLYLVFIMLLHGISAMVLWALFTQPPTHEQTVQLGASLLSFLSFFLLMSAMLGAFRLVHAGRELGLLLGSPVPFARLLWMRTLSLVVTSWTSAVLLAVPVANMGTLLGHPRFLLIYPVTLGLAACMSAFALTLVALVLRIFGVLRARRVLQVLQALVPLLFVLLTVINRQHHPDIATAAIPAATTGMLRAFSGIRFAAVQPLLQWPARAATGEPLALIGFGGVCLLVLLVSVWLVRSAMLAALQAPEVTPSAKVRAGGRERPFRSGLAWLLIAKEWRTLLRSPPLATGLLMQPLIVLPVFYINVMQGRLRLASAAAAATFVASQTTQYVARLMISAEEAPALLGAAPVSRAQVIRYKCIAALLPVSLMLVPVLLWLSIENAWVATVALFCASGAAFCACAFEVARPYPVPRRSFLMRETRRRRDPLDILGVVVMQLGWTAGAWFLASGRPWGAAIVIGVLLVPFLGWWRDVNRQSLLGY